jgi:nucleoid-associated protein YgaU
MNYVQNLMSIIRFAAWKNMKNFNMRLLSVAVALSISPSIYAQATSATARASVATSGNVVEISPNAPDKHVVVKGDTLWGISGKFLQKPWRWPEVWQLNKEQIANPHLIYPGNVVYLDMTGGVPRLRLGQQVDGGATASNVKLGPQARAASLDASPIPTINALAIEPFLNRPLVVSEKELADAPRVMATQEGRVYLGAGDLAYVRGLKETQTTEYHLYRNAKPILDPDTRLVLGYEATFVGTGRLERDGDPATIRLQSVKEEVGIGDRLMPVDKARAITYAPRAPDKDITSKIIAVHRGVSQAGKYSVVSINNGSADGMQVGHVLAIENTGATVLDRESATRNDMVKLPNETIGHMMVFRVFDKISYGLIMDTSTNVPVGSTVKRP